MHSINACYQCIDSRWIGNNTHALKDGITVNYGIVTENKFAIHNYRLKRRRNVYSIISKPEKPRA